jgi:uncharacterized iron-regulated membrane protein
LSSKNSSFRTAVFWLHLAAGVVAGIIVLVMSVTGVLLMYEQQILRWADRGYRSAPPAAGTQRLPVEALLARAVEQRPGINPSGLSLQADPAAPAAVSLGREGTLYVNPYTGEVLGDSAPKLRQFFHVVTDWHRWLGQEGEGRDTGRAITGACNLAFLFLIVTGFYLWFPRKWTRRQLRNVLWFRGGLPGKARDFNWHNVIGFWTAVPLFLIVLSGVLISYPKATELLYRAMGEEPPARRDGPPQAGGAGREPRERRAEGGPGRQEGQGRLERSGPRREGGPAGGGPGRGEERPFDLASLDGLDELWAVAESRQPGWKTLSTRFGGSPDEASFTILRGERGRPDLRAQLTLDRATGEEVRWETYADQSPARRVRSWSRWIHTGEAGGFLGQTLAGLASAGSAVLVWTGIALAFRRFFPSRRRVKNSGAEAEEVSLPFEDVPDPGR